SPQVAEQAIAIRSGGIEAFAAEDPELTRVGRKIEHVPIARSKARPWDVAHEWVDYGAGHEAIDARLADGGGTLYPNPLAALIFPEITERAIARGIVALSAVEPEISGGVGPSSGIPARTGNIGGGTNALHTIITGLIDDVGAAHPGPLARFELPQIVQSVRFALGIEVESTEEPEIPRRIEPGH